MIGWIKIHRDLASHWLSQDMEKLGRWVDLLLLANHTDSKVLIGGTLIELKRGQIAVSLSFLADRWKTSKRTVLNFLQLLELDKMCTRKSNRKVTILTICNYDSYQMRDNKGVTDKVTDKYPIGNRQVTETKNVEECKRIYNTTTAHTHTHEESYIEQYKQEARWQDVAQILHQPISECETLFERWVLEYQHNGEVHQNFGDFKKHFIQWARVAIAKEKKNGNNRETNSKRGRADVPDEVSLNF